MSRCTLFTDTRTRFMFFSSMVITYQYIILQFTIDYQLFHNYYYTCN
nr:MAG TPA: hypothetical protein [Caudoviricetes sp.]